MTAPGRTAASRSRRKLGAALHLAGAATSVQARDPDRAQVVARERKRDGASSAEEPFRSVVVLARFGDRPSLRKGEAA